MPGDGCQTHAGILKRDEGTLTDIAKKRFIDDVKNNLIFGTDNIPEPLIFPCGKPVPPNPWAADLDLENEEKFPDFHKYFLKSYEKIARALDLPGDYKFLPICCPVSLGFSLDVDLDLEFLDGFLPFFTPALPLLAIKLNIFPPPDLALKFPDLPKIPPPIPQFELPTFDPKLLFDLFNFNMSFIVGIPKFVADLALNIPQLVLKLPSFPDLFSSICDIAFDSDLFGDIDSRSIVEITSLKVLTAKVAECSFLAAVGTTMGSAPGGLTGGVGKKLGYIPEEKEPAQPTNVRDRVLDFANKFVGPIGKISFSSDEDKYTSSLLYNEWGDGNDPQRVAYAKAAAGAREASSCGMFARACCAAGGASEDFFHRDYSQRWSQIMHEKARITYAIKYGPGMPEIPALKRGDLMIVGVGVGNTKEQRFRNVQDEIQHAIIIAEDYSGGREGPLHVIHGGQIDEGNNNAPTSVSKFTYEKTEGYNPFRIREGSFLALGIGNKSRIIMAIYDMEKIVGPLPPGITLPNL